MKRPKVSAEMELDSGAEVLLEGEICPAEPEVGYQHDYVDDCVAYNGKANRVLLNNDEHDRAIRILNDKLEEL